MRALGNALGVLAIVLYPLVVWLGLSRYSARVIALAGVALLLPRVAFALRNARRADVVPVLWVPASVGAVLAVAAILDDRRFVLAMPVVMSAVLLAHFAGSLRTVPLVERFARLRSPELSPAQVRYCRTVTLVWSGFFVVNASVALTLTLAAPVWAWTLYTGLLAYVAMAVLGATEYVVRKARFRELGGSPVDRVLARLLPRRTP